MDTITNDTELTSRHVPLGPHSITVRLVIAAIAVLQRSGARPVVTPGVVELGTKNIVQVKISMSCKAHYHIFCYYDILLLTHYIW